MAIWEPDAFTGCGKTRFGRDGYRVGIRARFSRPQTMRHEGFIRLGALTKLGSDRAFSQPVSSQADAGIFESGTISPCGRGGQMDGHEPFALGVALAKPHSQAFSAPSTGPQSFRLESGSFQHAPGPDCLSDSRHWDSATSRPRPSRQVLPAFWVAQDYLPAGAASQRKPKRPARRAGPGSS